MKFKQNLDPKYTRVSFYVVITFMIIYLLMKIADNIGGIFSAVGSGLNWLNVLMKPLGWGFVISYLLFPVTEFWEKRLQHLKIFEKRGKSARGLSVAITSIIALVAIVILLSVIISTITSSIQVIRISDLEDMITSLAATMNSFYETVSRQLSQLNISSDQVNAYLKNIGDFIAEWFKNTGSGLQNSIYHLKDFFTSALFAIIFGIYFMLDGKSLMRYWNRALKAFSSKRFDRIFHMLVSDADAVFSGYVRGQLIDALFMMVSVSVSLSLVGVKFSVIIGILTGIGNLIPYVGPFVAYISTILVCILNGDWKRLVVALIVLLILQAIDGNVINPKLLSASISIHPMLVIASLIIGSAIGGIIGMLLAVPVGAFLKIQFERLVNYLMKNRHIEEEKTTGADQSPETAAQKPEHSEMH